MHKETQVLQYAEENHVETQEEGKSEGLGRNQSCWQLNLDFIFQNREKINVSHWDHPVWYFVMTPLANEDMRLNESIWLKAKPALVPPTSLATLTLTQAPSTKHQGATRECEAGIWNSFLLL